MRCLGQFPRGDHAKLKGSPSHKRAPISYRHSPIGFTPGAYPLLSQVIYH